MEKVKRNGNVAVLVSSGFGAGWFSWNNNQELLFHPKLVEMVEQNRKEEITKEWVKENLGIEDVYCGGAYNLYIEWVPEGSNFRIDEYDGAESLILNSDLNVSA